MLSLFLLRRVEAPIDEYPARVRVSLLVYFAGEAVVPWRCLLALNGGIT
jgi:hypothetical protein